MKRGVIAAAVLFIRGYKTTLDAVYMGLCCFMLVITKDIAKLYALFLLLG